MTRLKRRRRNLGAAVRAVEEQAPSPKEQAILERAGETLDVSPGVLHPHPLNRSLRGLDEDHIQALMQSIPSVGQITPIIARPHPENEGEYIVLSGHHRLEALRRLNMRARIVVHEPRTRADELCLLAEANAQRELDFLDRAALARAMHEEGDHTADEIAILAPSLGSRATIHIMLSFFSLPPRIQELAREAGAGPAVVRAVTQLVKGGDKWRKRAERLLARKARAADFERAVAEMQAEQDGHTQRTARSRGVVLVAAPDGSTILRWTPGKARVRAEILIPNDISDRLRERIEELAREIAAQYPHDKESQP